MPFLTPRLTRFLTRMLDSLAPAEPSLTAGLRSSRTQKDIDTSSADRSLLLMFTSIPFRFKIRRQIRLIMNTNGETDPERKVYRMDWPDEPRSTRSAQLGTLQQLRKLASRCLTIRLRCGALKARRPPRSAPQTLPQRWRL